MARNIPAPRASEASSDNGSRQGQSYSALETHDRDGLADDTVHAEVAASAASPPSYHLLEPDQDASKQGLCESTSGGPDGKKNATKSYNKDLKGDGKAHLPPRALTPLSNWQIALLFFELGAVVALAILGIKGLLVLPRLDLFSVPPITQDCGGYSVPAVERSFYINLQIARDLSFTRAKLLDLAWDTIVGQGGRFLHGWLLYQVAASQLAWMMEYSSVPYYFQLDILFATASLPALWSTIRFLGTKRPARAVFSAVWFLLAILYVLAFASIWSAATGYLNPSKPAYLMEDHSYVTIDSDSLRLCTTVDAERLNGTVPALVQGPKVGACVDSFEYLTPGLSCDDPFVWAEWDNIKAYGQTKQMIQSFFSSADPTIILNETIDIEDWQSARFHGNRSAPQGLYRQFIGPQFTGAGQGVATFQLDTSIDMSRALVPYNSTFWWNGSGIPLKAPFLDFPSRKDDCSWGFGSAGKCLCYKDAVLTSDFRQQGNLQCISEQGYVWGFSSIITLIGVILEVCWIVGCFGMWLDVHMNSSLFQMNRRGSGVVRNILDVGGAIRNDLGRDTGAYGNSALLKELEKLPPVGYEVADDGECGRVSVVSMPRARRRGGGPKAAKLYA